LPRSWLARDAIEDTIVNILQLISLLTNLVVFKLLAINESNALKHRDLEESPELEDERAESQHRPSGSSPLFSETDDKFEEFDDDSEEGMEEGMEEVMDEGMDEGMDDDDGG